MDSIQVAQFLKHILKVVEKDFKVIKLKITDQLQNSNPFAFINIYIYYCILIAHYFFVVGVDIHKFLEVI
jgi:hypothetical protein